MSYVKDLDTRLLKVGPDDDITTRDCCGAIHFWAGIGGGKTSASHVLAGAYLRAMMGALITVTKSDHIPLWEGYARKHGRARSLILVDGVNETFNFIDYLLASQGMEGAAGTVVDCFLRIVDATRKASGTASHHGGEAYWEDAMREALRYTVPAIYAADGSVSIPAVIRFISTAPANLQEPTDRTWQERSFMYRKLNAALCDPKVPMSAHALKNAIAFWSERWAGLPEKTRGNVVATITATLDRFNHGRLQRFFCGRTTVVPELSFHGSLLLLATPTTVWGEDAIIAQQLFKFMWQRAVLSRNGLEPKHRDRFLFLWSDEAQDLVNSYDYEFLSLCRSSRCCVTYLTQSLPTYYAKLGGDNARDAALALAGKFMTHIFGSNSCAETNDFAARTLGRVVRRRGTYNIGTSESVNVGMNAGESENSGSSSNHGSSHGSSGGSGSNNFNHGWGHSTGTGGNWGENRGRGTSQNISEGYSENMEYAIEPGDFARMLKTGGTRNGNEVTAVWFQAGRVFRGSGTNWLLARFKQ